MSMPGDMTEPDIPGIESLICLLPASITCIDYDIMNPSKLLHFYEAPHL